MHYSFEIKHNIWIYFLRYDDVNGRHSLIVSV